MVKTKIQTKLIPDNDLDGILKELDDLEAQQKIGPDLYGTAVVLCEEAKKADLSFGILGHAANKFPDFPVRT